MHEESKRAAFINGLVVIHADGVSDPRERVRLWQFKEEVGISDQEAIDWYGQVRAGNLEIQPLQHTGDALRMVELLAEIAVVDGKVTEAERVAVNRVAEACGLSSYSLRQITARAWGKAT